MAHMPRKNNRIEETYRGPSSFAVRQDGIPWTPQPIDHPPPHVPGQRQPDPPAAELPAVEEFPTAPDRLASLVVARRRIVGKDLAMLDSFVRELVREHGEGPGYWDFPSEQRPTLPIIGFSACKELIALCPAYGEQSHEEVEQRLRSYLPQAHQPRAIRINSAAMVEYTYNVKASREPKPRFAQKLLLIPDIDDPEAEAAVEPELVAAGLLRDYDVSVALPGEPSQNGRRLEVARLRRAAGVDTFGDYMGKVAQSAHTKIEQAGGLLLTLAPVRFGHFTYNPDTGDIAKVGR